MSKRLLVSGTLLMYFVLISQMTSGSASGVGQELTAILAAPTSFAATASGDVYYHLGEGDLSGVTPQRWTLVGHIATSSSIISIRDMGGDGSHEYVWAYASDGSFFVSDDTGHTWTLRGNVLNSVTPITNETWGSLKTRYR